MRWKLGDEVKILADRAGSWPPLYMQTKVCRVSSVSRSEDTLMRGRLAAEDGPARVVHLDAGLVVDVPVAGGVGVRQVAISRVVAKMSHRLFLQSM